MKKTKMEKGITLIALIITIVVLLILAVVAINAITKDDILGKAENATKKYNQSVENEQETMGKYEEYLNNLISFAIEGTTYKAEKGMTWAEWCASDYNTGNWETRSIELGRYFDSTGKQYIKLNEVTVTSADTIIANTQYTIGMEVCCFDAGTQILMADNTTKNIEDVQVGDMVMSYNTDTNSLEARKVLQTLIREFSDDLVECAFSDGRTVRMRAYHPLLTTEGYKSLRCYKEFLVLEIGDEIITVDGTAKLLSVTPIETTGNYITYNLNIAGQEDGLEGYDNYVANGIIAHNANCSNESSGF